MSTPTSAVLIAAKYCETAQTTQYTATNDGAIVDLFTVTNITASEVTFSAHIVASGGSASSANKIVHNQTVLPGQAYIAYELGHHMAVGGFISTTCSAGSSLVIYASGRVLA